MRITTQTIQRNILNNLNRITYGLSQVYDQLASGKQINTLSDNPMGAITALGLRSNVAELNQYQRNLVFGNNWITNSESSLSETKNLLMRGKVLALQSINGVLTPENREIIAKEVKNLYDQSVLLANSQMNGKYLFGGYRTSGYNAVEPAPFIPDTVDGYRINGTNIPFMDESLTGTVSSTADLAVGDLLINNEDMGPVVLTAGLTDGLNMGGAANLKAAINLNSTSVDARLTTLYSGGPATADTLDGTDTDFSFSLNGIAISVSIPDGSNAATVATLTAAAINSASERTGVEALSGDGTNGGAANSVVFKNMLAGEEKVISITDFSLLQGDASPGFGPADVNQGVDATHNTGQISLSSTESFSITTSASDDTILDLIGLGGPDRFFNDEADDGTLTYGYRLNSGDLIINGLEIGAADDDGFSTVYADTSAMAKAAAINAALDQTGVAAEVTPVYLQATGGPVNVDLDNPPLTGTVNNIAISAGNLAVNGYPTTVDIVSELPVNGLAMGMAASAKAAIMQADPDVEVRLTTLMAGDPIMSGLNAGESVSFTVNGVAVNYTALLGLTTTQTAQEIVDAANAAFTGAGLTIEALVGDGNNGGAVDSIVFRNTNNGDESQIVIAGINPADPVEAKIGLANGTYISDETHNTGQISIDALDKFTLTSPGVGDDSILDNLGLGGGGRGFGDVANDGELIYGRRMSAIGTGDLVINGVDIFSASTGIAFLDSDNTLINAINAKKDLTGIAASRSSNGRIILSAQDGRNLHVQTSANGERITRLNLNGSSPATPQSKVYFGSVRLVSDRTFMVEDPSRSLAGTPSEWALTGLGLAGGAAITGEPTDEADDGEISVKSILEQEDSIRYAGDRLNDINIKVGKTSTLAIGRNGQDTLMNTKVFSSLKELELHLTGEHYTAVTGVEKATDLSVPLADGGTGLTREDEFTSGYFSITVTDHAYAPPRDFAISIGVDPEKDTLNSMATKIDGVPGVNASWDDDGQLSIEVSDPERFTIKLQDGSARFLELVGITPAIMQNQALDQDLVSLDGAMNALTNQISEFGAKANRIDVQNNILNDLELNSTEQLSETEEKDLAEALLQLKTKEAAYQAALTAASRVMQMSLVDFLR